jgi:hypothetical protein
MIDRKINVEKLTEEQLAKAEAAISEKVRNKIDWLVDRWNPVFSKNNHKCRVKIAIGYESEITPSSDIQLEIDPTYDSSVTENLKKDILESMIECNKFLSRYGIVCDMTMLTEPA